MALNNGEAYVSKVNLTLLKIWSPGRCPGSSNVAFRYFALTVNFWGPQLSPRGRPNRDLIELSVAIITLFFWFITQETCSDC